MSKKELGLPLNQILNEQQLRYLVSPKKKHIRMNFFNNSICINSNDYSKQQKKNIDYLTDTEKDLERYQKVKRSMKEKFFKIKQRRRSTVKKPSHFAFTQPEKESSSQRSYKNHHVAFESESRPSTRLQFSRQFQRVLNLSSNLSSQKKLDSKKRTKLLSQSEMNKKNENVINSQRDLIIRFVKRQSKSLVMPKKEDITNKQKFTMDFNTYLRRKSEKQIQKNFYENKVRIKTKPLEKFQDFILQEVKFNQEHKEKLSRYFMKMREEINKAQNKKVIKIQ